MKPNLILMSHGNLASTLIESAKMILGDLPKDYYDVTIEMNFDGYSQETGEHVHIKNSDLYDTQYCSNNFEECKRFWGIDPVRANRTANMCIKERFTAEQLLAFYQQGLTLQDKLMALVYHE